MENSKVDHFEVFISYRRKTGVQDARTLYYALKSIGIRAFLITTASVTENSMKRFMMPLIKPIVLFYY